jgi:predicted tellurium resistance membrane protein TerC
LYICAFYTFLMDISSQFQELFTANGLLQLLVLSLLEVVLGIDNLIFISLTAAKILDKKQRGRARITGLAFALIIRGGMLFSISWLASASAPLFYLGSLGISLGNLVMLAGGIFLLWKTTVEIKEKIYNEEDEERTPTESISMKSAIVQIIIIDFVFSFDSILAAIKVAQKTVESTANCPCEAVQQAGTAAAHAPQSNIVIMVGGVLISMLIMLMFSEGVSKFINQYPTIKMLALAFLLIIGTSLVLDCFHIEIPKPFLYSALGFGIFVEGLNIYEKRMRKKRNRHKQESEIADKGKDKGNEL